MNVTPFLNVSKKDKVANIDIVGDIGYNFWADTYEEYKTNTSEQKANEIKALQELEVDVINVTMESLGGDVSHALAIYSLLKNSGATINTYYRGANASASTIIGSAASSVENIYMDNTGLFLVHKVMSWAQGNVNDMQESIDSLNKWQTALEQAYLNLGVSQDTLNDLMSRNGGHGEWLTFAEAKEYGFVGNEWETKKVVNYSKATFQNKGILIPNKLINQKPKEMDNKEVVLNDAQEKTLFAKFKAYFKNETEAEELEQAKAKELEDLKAELEEANKKIAEMETPIEENAEEVVEEVAEEVVEPELTMDEIIQNKVKDAIKNIVEPTQTKGDKITNTIEPFWKQILNLHQNLNK